MLKRLMFWKNREPRPESADYAAAEPKRCGNAACCLCGEETVEATLDPAFTGHVRWASDEDGGDLSEARPEDPYAIFASLGGEVTAEDLGYPRIVATSPALFAPFQVLPEPFIVTDDPEAGVYP